MLSGALLDDTDGCAGFQSCVYAVNFCGWDLDVLVPAWYSGNALDSINAVTLCRAQLVPGWMTVFGRVNHPGTEPGTQVDSA